MIEFAVAVVIHRRALDVMPGIMAAKRRGDAEGVLVLQAAYMDFVDAHHVPHSYGLAALYTAATKIADVALEALANERGISFEDLTTKLSLSIAVASE